MWLRSVNGVSNLALVGQCVNYDYCDNDDKTGKNRGTTKTEDMNIIESRIRGCQE